MTGGIGSNGYVNDVWMGSWNAATNLLNWRYVTSAAPWSSPAALVSTSDDYLYLIGAGTVDGTSFTNDVSMPDTKYGRVYAILESYPSYCFHLVPLRCRFLVCFRYGSGWGNDSSARSPHIQRGMHTLFNCIFLLSCFLLLLCVIVRTLDIRGFLLRKPIVTRQWPVLMWSRQAGN